MNESQRTLGFVAAAVVSLIAARFAGPSAVKQAADISNVGQDFFPDFKEAEAAKALTVASYNADQATVRLFGIIQGKDGLWRIPSHHNYPVDGKDKLAKTATSVMGIRREAFAGRHESQHAEFGVLDPQGDSVTDLQGVGNRVTLKDGEGKTLADLIIGKAAKDKAGFHYVRHPAEKATYLAKLNLDVSTRFVDWIESDLLKLEAARLREITIDTTSVDIRQGVLLQGDETRVHRASTADSWKIDGVDEATEEVNKVETDKLVSALDNLKITGVREKPPQLMASLKAGEELPRDKMGKVDLEMKGFYLTRTSKEGPVVLIPKDGRVVALTDQGVSYDLKFGETFNGTEEEVEIGVVPKGEDEAKDKGEEKADDADKSKKKDKPTQKSRYLFVTVGFNPDGLGKKPEAPVKPEEPGKEGESPAADSADALAPTNTTPDPKVAYANALAKYDTDQKKYESDVKAYEEKLKAGEKLQKELNARFANWYYVVSGDSFENLRQGRKTLVKEKSAEPKEGNAANPVNPADPANFAVPGQN